uniref:Uncharacterized protein n=1 Tax=viral metagenome TaxID=1070528 RepID=A0A6C0E783_9ZZZZ
MSACLTLISPEGKYDIATLQFIAKADEAGLYYRSKSVTEHDINTVTNLFDNFFEDIYKRLELEKSFKEKVNDEGKPYKTKLNEINIPYIIGAILDKFYQTLIKPHMHCGSDSYGPQNASQSELDEITKYRNMLQDKLITFLLHISTIKKIDIDAKLSRKEYYGNYETSIMDLLLLTQFFRCFEYIARNYDVSLRHINLYNKIYNVIDKINKIDRQKSEVDSIKFIKFVETVLIPTNTRTICEKDDQLKKIINYLDSE